jgi:hypothetical protein
MCHFATFKGGGDNYSLKGWRKEWRGGVVEIIVIIIIIIVVVVCWME